MAKGIIRKIDELGRITLPVEMRRSVNLETGDRPAIVLDGQVIRIGTREQRAMTRPLDEFGRIAIPIEYRRTLSFIVRQQVEMYVEGDDICIEKVITGCVICQTVDDVIAAKDFFICRKHAHMVIDAAAEDSL